MLGAACAVGVTSAFGSPVGGVLFSIEVTATYYLTSGYWRAFLTAVSGCIVFKLIGSLGWVRRLRLESGPHQATYYRARGSDGCQLMPRRAKGSEAATLGVDLDVASGQRELFDTLLPHAVLGLLLGLLAAGFIQLAAFLARWRRRPVCSTHGSTGSGAEGMMAAGGGAADRAGDGAAMSAGGELGTARVRAR